MRKRLLSKYDSKKYGWFKGSKKFVLAAVIVFLIFQLLIGFTYVNGNSMNPTLKNGQLVLYTRFTNNYKKGDIISVRISSGEYYVKRIVATAGDTINLKNGNVYINDELLDEPYISEDTFASAGSVIYPYTVGDNQVFILGDNRDESTDSRVFGAVSTRQIKGKLWLYAGKYYVKYLY